MLFGYSDKTYRWGEFNLKIASTYNAELIQVFSIERIFDFGDWNWLCDYIDSFKKFGFDNDDLVQTLRKPLNLNWDKTNKTIEYISYHLLLEIAQIFIEAKDKGYLGILDLHLAQKAGKIIEFHQKISLNHFIAYETGRSFYLSNQIEKLSIKAFELSQNPIYHWIPSISEDLLSELFQINDFTWELIPTQKSEALEILNTYFVIHLPESIYEILSNKQPKRQYKRKNYQPQQPNNTDFANYLVTLKSLLHSTKSNKKEFDQLFERVFPKNLDRKIADIPEVKQELSATDNFIVESLF